MSLQWCGFRKLWRANSGNSGTVCRSRQCLLQVQMTGSPGGSIEMNEPPTFQDRSRIAAARSSSCSTLPHVRSGLLVVKILRALGSCASGAVGGRCSSHLETPESQRRVHARVHEKACACNSFQIKKKEWCRRGESNPRPRDYETLALPLSYAGRTQSFMLRIRLRMCQGAVFVGFVGTD